MDKSEIMKYAIILIIAFFLSYLEIVDLKKIESYLTTTPSRTYIPEYRKDYIQELNFVYIGSSTCKYSNIAELYTAIDSIKTILSESSKKLGLGFSTIGISAEWSPVTGLNHLDKFGEFNELILGNSWNNTGIIRYVGEMANEASTPQIIVTIKTYTEFRKINIVSEKKVITKKGTAEILNWYKNGASLPAKFLTEIDEDN